MGVGLIGLGMNGLTFTLWKLFYFYLLFFPNRFISSMILWCEYDNNMELLPFKMSSASHLMFIIPNPFNTCTVLQVLKMRDNLSKDHKMNNHATGLSLLCVSFFQDMDTIFILQNTCCSALCIAIPKNITQDSQWEKKEGVGHVSTHSAWNNNSTLWQMEAGVCSTLSILVWHLLSSLAFPEWLYHSLRPGPWRWWALMHMIYAVGAHNTR